MSIFRRLFKIGQAHANRAVDKMEKPEVMLEQAIRDQTRGIAEAKGKVQQVIAAERQARALLNKEENGKADWERKAMTALQSNNEDLAGKALMRSEEYEQRANSLRPQWEAQKQGVDQLKVAIQKMEDELAELKRNKDLIIAQAKAAEVKKQIYEAKAKIGTNNTGDLVARMKAKAEQASYEAQAAEEMAEVGSGGDTLEKEFASLEASPTSSSVSDKLAALKAKMGK